MIDTRNEVRCTDCGKIVTGPESREAKKCGKCRRGENKPPAAIDCRWDTAKEGDLLALPGPILDTEVMAKVVKVFKGKIVYDLYLLGVWIGRASATWAADGKHIWTEEKP